ncbi:FAD-dependent oxidoreductase [Clostridium sediminicola]|uniref:NAD(P)/FAD-dependent oxidoreductase n=1 Tax=Clostridium sediminicola TaxID=3114879 RepID=UPI0031F20CE9
MYDVIIVGGGPAGLAAAIGAEERRSKCLIIEREKRLGGILKQCIHDGFGLITFKEILTGPEYGERYINILKKKDIDIYTSTYVTSIKKEDEIFKITLVNSSKGIFEEKSKVLILANGCRERTHKQIFINGTRPSGIFTAGTAQYLVNISGYLPCRRCVILGSGDIGLIMARRLTLEGAKVLGVYEAKSDPSGLSRNIAQCLDDFSIPLYLSKTITRIIGDKRVEAVEISSVDDQMVPIKGTEEIIECDAVILSVGLIPENENAESLGIEIHKVTKGPIVDQNFMTSVEGVYSCGNALHVNDLVDYVSESGKYAGIYAAEYSAVNEHIESRRKNIEIQYDSKKLLYVVPQKLDLLSNNPKVILYFRTKTNRRKTEVIIKIDEEVFKKKTFKELKPSEMKRLELNLDKTKKITSFEVILKNLED